RHTRCLSDWSSDVCSSDLRLHNKQGMIDLIHCINGYIRHSSRLLQLHRVCLQLSIPLIQPTSLNKDSSWFAGFFDADGKITMSRSEERRVGKEYREWCWRM